MLTSSLLSSLSSSDTSKFLNACVQDFMASHEVPRSVRAEHEMALIQNHQSYNDTPTTLNRVLTCRCGFRIVFSESYLLAMQHRALNNAILEHALEVASTFRITLSELTDLGWFVDDEYGSL